MQFPARLCLAVISVAAIVQSLVDEEHTDSDALELSIDVKQKIRHGDSLTIRCIAKLWHADSDYELKHLWLHDERNDGKIAAYFPGRQAKPQPEYESHDDMYTVQGANVNLEDKTEMKWKEETDPEKFADHFQATLHEMRVEKEKIVEEDHTIYILTAYYPTSTCYQQTSYHCWAFALPIPKPKETDKVDVTVTPC